MVTAPRAAPADSVENLALAWFSRYVEAPLTTYRRNPSRRNAIALGRAFRHGADEDSTGHTLLGFSVQQETRRQLPPVSARYAQYDGSFYDIPWEDEHREEPPVPAQARRTSLLIADVVRAEFTLRYWENAVTGANHAVPPPRRTEGQVRTILRRVLGI